MCGTTKPPSLAACNARIPLSGHRASRSTLSASAATISRAMASTNVRIESRSLGTGDGFPCSRKRLGESRGFTDLTRIARQRGVRASLSTRAASSVATVASRFTISSDNESSNAPTRRAKLARRSRSPLSTNRVMVGRARANPLRFTRSSRSRPPATALDTRPTMSSDSESSAAPTRRAKSATRCRSPSRTIAAMVGSAPPTPLRLTRSSRSKPLPTVAASPVTVSSVTASRALASKRSISPTPADPPAPSPPAAFASVMIASSQQSASGCPIQLVVSHLEPMDRLGRRLRVGRIVVVEHCVGGFVLSGLDEAEHLAVVITYRRTDLDDGRNVLGQRFGLEVRGRPGLADRDVGGITERERVLPALDVQTVAIDRNPATLAEVVLLYHFHASVARNRNQQVVICLRSLFALNLLLGPVDLLDIE